MRQIELSIAPPERTPKQERANALLAKKRALEQEIFWMNLAVEGIEDELDDLGYGGDGCAGRNKAKK